MLTALLADMRERDFVSPQRMSHRLRLPLADMNCLEFPYALHAQS